MAMDTLKWLSEPAGPDRASLDVKKNPFMKQGGFGFLGWARGSGLGIKKPEPDPFPFLFLSN